MSAAGRRRPGEKLPPPAKTNHTSPSCNPCLDDRACASPVQPLTSPRRTLDACLATVTRRVRCPLAGYTAIILMLKSDPNPNLTGRLHGHHPGLCPRPSVLCRAAHPQRRQRQRSEHGEPPHPSHTLACLPCVGRVWWWGGGGGALGRMLRHCMASNLRVRFSPPLTRLGRAGRSGSPRCTAAP